MTSPGFCACPRPGRSPLKPTKATPPWSVPLYATYPAGWRAGTRIAPQRIDENPHRTAGRAHVLDLAAGDPVVDRAAADSHKLTRLRDREGFPIGHHDRRLLFAHPGFSQTCPAPSGRSGASGDALSLSGSLMRASRESRSGRDACAPPRSPFLTSHTSCIGTSARNLHTTSRIFSHTTRSSVPASPCVKGAPGRNSKLPPSRYATSSTSCNCCWRTTPAVRGQVYAATRRGRVDERRRASVRQV